MLGLSRELDSIRIVSEMFAAGWLLASLLALAVTAVPEPLTITRLKDSRSELGFIPYTPEERVFVAQQAQNLFSVCPRISHILILAHTLDRSTLTERRK